MSRLKPQPGELVDRSKTVTFKFDGKQVTALAGDTIGSALHAGDVATEVVVAIELAEAWSLTGPCCHLAAVSEVGHLANPAVGALEHE